MIVSYTGAESVQRWLIDEIDSLSLSSDTIEFLVESGLPQIRDWTFDFGVFTGSLPRLNRVAQPFFNLDLSASAGLNRSVLFVLGSDYGDPICIDVVNNERIVIIGPEPPRTCYCNSSVATFGLSLRAFLEYRNAKLGSKMASAKQLRRELLSIDPSSLSDSNSLWSTVIEEAGYGL